LVAKLLKPITKILFKDIKKDSPAVGDIAMSISANALGLTNAATPIGLKVMKELQEDNENKEEATDSMCMFLGMNTAGFQIIPATVIAILVGVGSKNPTEIILPTLIVTTLAFFTAIITALILKKLWRKHD
jgi:spore maturation protein A